MSIRVTWLPDGRKIMFANSAPRGSVLMTRSIQVRSEAGLHTHSHPQDLELLYELDAPAGMNLISQIMDHGEIASPEEFKFVFRIEGKWYYLDMYNESMSKVQGMSRLGRYADIVFDTKRNRLIHSKFGIRAPAIRMLIFAAGGIEAMTQITSGEQIVRIILGEEEAALPS